jgi:hypothetical protein
LIHLRIRKPRKVDSVAADEADVDAEAAVDSAAEGAGLVAAVRLGFIQILSSDLLEQTGCAIG